MMTVQSLVVTTHKADVVITPVVFPESEAIDELDLLFETLFAESATDKLDRHLPCIDPATGKYDCFGKESKFFANSHRSNCCGHCKCGRTDCKKEGDRLQRLESERHSRPAIVLPDTLGDCHGPAAECDHGTPKAAAPAYPSLFDSLEFGAAMYAIQDKDAAAIIDELKTVSGTIRPIGGKTCYTHELQAKLVAASLELNTRGVIPLLRPIIRGNFQGGKSATTPDDITLSNHLRLIDLDYLAKNHPNRRGDIFEPLLNDDGSLNLTKALEWVSKKGRAAKKAELLLLTPREQAELFLIRDEKIRLRWKDLQDQRRKCMQKIKAAIEKAAFHKQKKEPICYLWELYCMGVLHDWVTSAIIQSASRLPAKYSLDTPVTDRRIRNNINWLKNCFDISKADPADT